MVKIIHGNDTASSREFLNKLGLNFIRFDAVNLNIDDLRQVLKGDLLFGPNKNILIENLFSKKAKNVEEIIDLINESLGNIYIYDVKEIGLKNLKLFPKAEISIFSLPKSLFAFLDSIHPNNPRSVLLFDKALESNDLEILLFMIIRRLRIMLALQTNANIEETQKLEFWQKSKLLNQTEFFGNNKLKKSFKKIFDIDYASKTGRLRLPLKQSIDIFLLNL